MKLIIGERQISQQHEPYIIAEAGVHHDNSVELAKKYIMIARIAGADAIKFQTYSAQRLASKWAPTYWEDPSKESQYNIFAKRSLFGENEYKELFEYANKLGITLLSTPFDPDSASLLAKYDMQAYKIASADLTYFPLIETVIQYKRPILLSTGAATYEEIKQTVDLLNEKKATFSLLHCVLSYPTKIKDANLQRITELQKRFPKTIIGYSDHTQPQDSRLACPISVALGAKIIEKHLSLNKLLEGDDHYHAVDETGLKQLVRDCKDAAMMTTQSEEFKQSEIPARTFARRSIVAARSLKANTVITINDIDFKRPGTGLSPTRVSEVLNKVLVHNLEEDDLIKLEDLSSK